LVENAAFIKRRGADIGEGHELEPYLFEKKAKKKEKHTSKHEKTADWPGHRTGSTSGKVKTSSISTENSIENWPQRTKKKNPK